MCQALSKCFICICFFLIITILLQYHCLPLPKREHSWHKPCSEYMVVFQSLEVMATHQVFWWPIYLQSWKQTYLLKHSQYGSSSSTSLPHPLHVCPEFDTIDNVLFETLWVMFGTFNLVSHVFIFILLISYSNRTRSKGKLEGEDKDDTGGVLKSPGLKLHNPIKQEMCTG